MSNLVQATQGTLAWINQKPGILSVPDGQVSNLTGFTVLHNKGNLYGAVWVAQKNYPSLHDMLDPETI